MNGRDFARCLVLAIGALAGLAPSCGSKDSGGAGAGGGAPAQQSTQLRSIDQCGRVTESVQLSSDLSTPSGACLTVAANGVTVDGNGPRITAGQFAVALVDRSNVIVRNVVSNQGVQFYGGQANGNVLEDSTVGKVGVYMGDDTVIRNNRREPPKP